jgi:hypothetical protein
MLEEWRIAYLELKAAGLALSTDFSLAARQRLMRAWERFKPLELARTGIAPTH